MPCLPAASPATLTADGIRARHGLGRPALYRAIRDHGFPRPLKIGSRSCWIAAEIDAWLAACAAERDATATAAVRETRRRTGLRSGEVRRAQREAAAATPDTATA